VAALANEAGRLTYIAVAERLGVAPILARELLLVRIVPSYLYVFLNEKECLALQLMLHSGSHRVSQAAEQRALLCRDESYEGLSFYPNFFLHAPALARLCSLPADVAAAILGNRDLRANAC